MKMYQLAALLALTVKAIGLFSRMLFLFYILKAGRGVRVYDILVDDTLVHKALHLPVNGSSAYAAAYALEVIAHVADGDMLTGYGLKIADKLATLFCIVFTFCSQVLNLLFETGFQF